MMEKVGLKAVGLSGKDGTVLRVQRKFSDGQDIGYVGEVTEVNPLPLQLLNSLLDQDFIPVICPIGSDDEYHSYNINADDAACAIATAMKASKLVFLTDIEGVYRDPADPGSLISEMTAGEALELLKSGNVGGGMLPKIQNCVTPSRPAYPGAYPGRPDRTFASAGVLHQPGYRNRYYRDEEERYHVEQ